MQDSKLRIGGILLQEGRRRRPREGVSISKKSPKRNTKLFTLLSINTPPSHRECVKIEDFAKHLHFVD